MSTKLLYSNVEYIPDNLRQQATKTERGYELDAKPLLEKHKELQAELHRNRETNDSLKALASSNPTAAQFVLREQELRQRLEREKNDAVQATKVEYQALRSCSRTC